MTNNVEEKPTPAAPSLAAQTTMPATSHFGPIVISGKCICINHKKYCAVAKWVTHVIESPGCIVDGNGPIVCTPPIITHELEIEWVERGPC